MDIIYEVTINGENTKFNLGPEGFLSVKDNGALTLNDGEKIINAFGPAEWSEARIINEKQSV